MFFTGLLNNITLMLALCFFYRLIVRRWSVETLTGTIFTGLVFGGVAIIGMLYPVEYSTGLIFDGRTILLSVLGLYGGPMPTAIAVAMTGVLRIWQGGVGLWTGLATIVSSALIGVLYGRMRVRRPWIMDSIYLYLFGVVVHVVMLLCMLLLPDDMQWLVLGEIAAPILIIYPGATMLYGLLMVQLEEKEKASIALRENEAQLKAMFDHSFLFIALLAPDGRVQHVNRPALVFIGRQEETVIGVFFGETPWWSGRKAEQDTIHRAIQRAAMGQSTRQEVSCMTNQQDERILDLFIKPVFDAQNRVIFVVAEGWDISDRKKLEKQLQQKTREIHDTAYYDVLTGLPNRAHLNQKLQKVMAEARHGKGSGSILFIDLDDLKMVNDAFGHSVGDQMIIKAGQDIIAAAGNQAFVSRISGDEFIVILLGENDRTRVAHIANCIIDVICKEPLSGANINISASAGVAIYPDDGDTDEDILKHADNALYVAKRSGKNCSFFYEKSMQMQAYEKMMLINSLRNALNRRELVLHYQPQVTAAGRIVVGFEALLRWNSPEHGSVLPSLFIPLAEESGLIRPIGQWVFREACVFARRLSDMGRGDIRIAVNVSPRQLADPDFINIVRTILADVDIKPCQLELEITESVLLVSIDDTIQKLNELQSMGLRLSLDDFGTGYSSLTYLQRLPVNTMKIDKTFIDMIMADEVQPAIIASIIDMAHVLKMSVVAEGVEKERQYNYLVQNQCDVIQGYFIGRPVSGEEAIQFLINMDQEERAAG
ncbi:MAG: diguanylate cyclase/phosphodiesterase [Firmicutes bacterium]|nr:diguanylate cyclase/phosphodiesterase [Bacillota bacterium]